jgi:hypothetical protein
MIKTADFTANELAMVPASVRTGDPTTRFEEMVSRTALSLDRRTNDELVYDGRELADPVLREHALFVYFMRNGAAALPVIERAIHSDPDTDLRINLLWALEWLPGAESREICRSLLNDRVHRVSEWARVFAWEMGWSDQDFRRARPFRHDPGRTFDQTIYLHVACNLYVKLDPGHEHWGHLLLSPQMVKRVYGQPLACNRMETRDDEVVVAKTLCGLHADGSEHHEAFLFRGFTELTNPLQGNFYFETETRRPVYVSGKANDPSDGIIDDVVVPFAREGQWFLNPHMELKGRMPIEYVRGLFRGWAYVNLERIEKNGGEFYFPGNSVLSTLHHPEAGRLTNAYVAGRFKGKVVDWDDDGVLDFNSLAAHATLLGEVDSDLDGIPDVPGRHVPVYPRP